MERLTQLVRKDFEDAVRERQLYFIGALFLLIGGVIGWIVGRSGRGPEAALAQFVLLALLFLGTLAATVLSYNGVVGKRVTGELRVLLGLPFSREEVLFGTFVGRVCVLGTMTAATVVLATLLAVAMGAAVSLTLVVAAFVAAVAGILMFTSLAIGISGSTTTTTRAAALAFGTFFVFVFRLWELVPLAIRFAVNGLDIPRGNPPAWAVAWGELSPLSALGNAVAGPTPELAGSFVAFAPSASGSAFYFQPWFGAVVVLLWIVGPLAVGLVRFRGADL